MLEVQQRLYDISAETSAAGASRNRDEPSPEEQALIQEAFERVARIVQGASPEPSSSSLPTPTEKTAKRGSVNAFGRVLRRLSKPRRSTQKASVDDAGPEQAEEPAGAASGTATEEASPIPSEGPQESQEAQEAQEPQEPQEPHEPQQETTAPPEASKQDKAKAKAEAKAEQEAKKEKSKSERRRRHEEKIRIKQENKFAKHEARAKRHEQKWRARREAHEEKKLQYRGCGHEPDEPAGGTIPPNVDLTSLPALITSAAADPTIAVMVVEDLASGDGHRHGGGGGGGVGGDGAPPQPPPAIGGGFDGASTPLSPPPHHRGARAHTPSATASAAGAGVSFPANRTEYKFASGMRSPVDARDARNESLRQAMHAARYEA